VFHPLYEIYENILNEELPLYQGIQTDQEVKDFMDFHLGVLSN